MNRPDPFADHRARLNQARREPLLMDFFTARPSIRAFSGAIEEIRRPKNATDSGKDESRAAGALSC
ncbi:MAG: hypothetical protein IPO40_06005 [Fibrobacteres bacterium]|nr:hypothetical protein [Fibrobacterota bacterium]